MADFADAAQFPVLVWMYRGLARHEESEVLAEFGEAYAHYMATTPAFLPRPRSRQQSTLTGTRLLSPGAGR